MILFCFKLTPHRILCIINNGDYENYCEIATENRLYCTPKCRYKVTRQDVCAQTTNNVVKAQSKEIKIDNRNGYNIII